MVNSYLDISSYDNKSYYSLDSTYSESLDEPTLIAPASGTSYVDGTTSVTIYAQAIGHYDKYSLNMYRELGSY